MKLLLAGLILGAVAGASFFAGRSSAPHSGDGLVRVQAQAAPQQAPDDPRELIPLGPGQGPGEGQGQRPGQQPQPGQGQGQCPVYLYKDGQLYQFQQPGPGQQPGQPQPGPGGGNGPGQPGGDGELFPIQPYNGPSPIPGLPTTPFDPGTRRL